MTTLMSMAPTINTAAPEASEAWHSVAWMENAACVGRDPELWYSFDKDEEALALAVCMTCPVIEECREMAMAEEGSRRTHGRFGILGGLRPNERLNLYRARLKARNP